MANTNVTISQKELLKLLQNQRGTVQVAPAKFKPTAVPVDPWLRVRNANVSVWLGAYSRPFQPKGHVMRDERKAFVFETFLIKLVRVYLVYGPNKEPVILGVDGPVKKSDIRVKG